MNINEILSVGSVIPVIVIKDSSHAIPLADALFAGGISIIEITLRTEAALEAIRVIRGRRPEMIVGAGTIITAALAHDAVSAGAQFGVSPGASHSIIDGCNDAGLSLLPGATTVSEIMVLAERGFQQMKFFPAEAAGGRPFLKSLISPFPTLRFCPTGGITETTALDWLVLENVPCVGGTWIASAHNINVGDFAGIKARASVASRLGGTRLE